MTNSSKFYSTFPRYRSRLTEAGLHKISINNGTLALSSSLVVLQAAAP
ncbi:MAG: hypothetical protein ACI9OJ_001828, partial [Myxococcota bacterium]